MDHDDPEVGFGPDRCPRGFRQPCGFFARHRVIAVDPLPRFVGMVVACVKRSETDSSLPEQIPGMAGKMSHQRIRSGEKTDLFVIASDECYSEIYPDEDAPPVGALQAAQRAGRTDFRNLVVFSSLSKRSNVPGLRSGFVAGDAEILRKFLRYRTYHGCAMGVASQAASIAAWRDEAHVIENRRLYREKFARVIPILSPWLDVSAPDAGFYLWAGVPGCDRAFARDLYAAYNVTILPGSLLARDTPTGNPGQGRVRISLVAEVAQCVEAAERIAQFCQTRQNA